MFIRSSMIFAFVCCLSFTTQLVAAPLKVTTSFLEYAKHEQVYDTRIATSGGAGSVRFAISAGALPDGITMNAKGRLLGTPIEEGNFTFTIKATDKSGSSKRKTYTLFVDSYTGTAIGIRNAEVCKIYAIVSHVGERYPAIDIEVYGSGFATQAGTGLIASSSETFVNGETKTIQLSYDCAFTPISFQLSAEDAVFGSYTSGVAVVR